MAATVAVAAALIGWRNAACYVITVIVNIRPMYGLCSCGCKFPVIGSNLRSRYTDCSCTINKRLQRSCHDIHRLNHLWANLNRRTTDHYIQQYGDWYPGRWWVGCYIWYSEEGPGRAAGLPISSSLYQMRMIRNSPPINSPCTNFVSFDVAL